jgi:hypothetical protein
MRTLPTVAAAAIAVAFLLPGSPGAFAAAAPSAAVADPGADLHARYESLRSQLEHNDFGRELRLESREQRSLLEGDVYGVLEQPFARVSTSLRNAASWCEVLMLPYNTKHCVAEDDHALGLFVGRKSDTPVEDAYRIDFTYRAGRAAADYFQVSLAADSGPLGTHDYRILLEATPLAPGRTFLHLSYSYRYGTISNLAMQTYLATAGAAKVGFTVEARDDDGAPRFVRGMRGVMERNTMRYFLAIEAYLDSLSAPPAARVARRIAQWFDASERYARQLHEMERDEYVAMKEREIERLPRLAGAMR